MPICRKAAPVNAGHLLKLESFGLGCSAEPQLPVSVPKQLALLQGISWGPRIAGSLSGPWQLHGCCGDGGTGRHVERNSSSFAHVSVQHHRAAPALGSPERTGARHGGSRSMWFQSLSCSVHMPDWPGSLDFRLQAAACEHKGARCMGLLTEGILWLAAGAEANIHGNASPRV